MQVQRFSLSLRLACATFVAILLAACVGAPATQDTPRLVVFMAVDGLP
jgi:hypothetical protein